MITGTNFAAKNPKQANMLMKSGRLCFRGVLSPEVVRQISLSGYRPRRRVVEDLGTLGPSYCRNHDDG